MSLPRKLMTLVVNTKLENTVNRPAIPATRNHASNKWTHSTVLNQLQGLVCTVPEETKFNVTSLLAYLTMVIQLHWSTVNGRMTVKDELEGMR
jgi:hypothetical protein